jgi:hypothetical protein
MSHYKINTDTLEQLCLRDFGPYKINNTVSIHVSTNTVCTELVPWSRNFNYTPHHTDNPIFYTPSGCNKNQDYAVNQCDATTKVSNYITEPQTSLSSEESYDNLRLGGTLININDYAKNHIIANKNNAGIGKISLSGEWKQCKLIIGTQIIMQINKHMGDNTIDIGAIPYCKLLNYYLDIQISGDTIISFDNVEFTEPVIFSNSNINNPNTYYVKKIYTNRGTVCTGLQTQCNTTDVTLNSKPTPERREFSVSGINYLRFMSDCAGLALPPSL